MIELNEELFFFLRDRFMLGYYSVLHELFFPKTKDEKRWKYHTPYDKMRRVFFRDCFSLTARQV